MEISKDYLSKFKKKKITKEQELAGQIYEWSGKQLKFPMLVRFINLKGYQAIYEIWRDVKNGKADDPIALFMWKIKQEKIIWNS